MASNQGSGEIFRVSQTGPDGVNDGGMRGDMITNNYGREDHDLELQKPADAGLLRTNDCHASKSEAILQLAVPVAAWKS